MDCNTFLLIVSGLTCVLLHSWQEIYNFKSSDISCDWLSRVWFTVVMRWAGFHFCCSSGACEVFLPLTQWCRVPPRQTALDLLVPAHRVQQMVSTNDSTHKPVAIFSDFQLHSFLKPSHEQEHKYQCFCLRRDLIQVAAAGGFHLL